MDRIRALPVFFTVILAGCQSTGSSQLALMEGIDTTNMISLADAVAAAQVEVPDGFAIEAVLEIEDDDENEPAAWEVVFHVAGQNQIVEVEVDAYDGHVVEVEIGEDGEDDGEDDDGAEANP